MQTCGKNIYVGIHDNGNTSRRCYITTAENWTVWCVYCVVSFWMRQILCVNLYITLLICVESENQHFEFVMREKKWRFEYDCKFMQNYYFCCSAITTFYYYLNIYICLFYKKKGYREQGISLVSGKNVYILLLHSMWKKKFSNRFCSVYVPD